MAGTAAAPRRDCCKRSGSCEATSCSSVASSQVLLALAAPLSLLLLLLLTLSLLSMLLLELEGDACKGRKTQAGRDYRQ